MNLPEFNGFRRSTTDYPNIEGKLRTRPLHYVVDLSTTRSAAAGTGLLLPIAGDSFYIDQRKNTGYATVHFQDTENNSCPVTVFSGFIARVPYHQLVIENDAQPGMSMVIIYGVDLDFVPTTGAGVSVNAAINISDVIGPACQHLPCNAGTNIGTNITNHIAIAANPNGIILRQLSYLAQAGAAGGTLQMALFAALIAPVGLAARANQLELMNVYDNANTIKNFQSVPLYRRIPAGWGVWSVTSIGTVNAALAQANLSHEVL